METEQRRGEIEQLLVPPAKKKKTNGGVATAGACLCPIAAAATSPLVTPPPAASSASARQALEQEVLARADFLPQLQGGGGGDRRRERRMRNRASAERSRARRHAYMNELETEVRFLRQENEQLKRLCEELKEGAAEVQAPPVKKTTTPPLPRTLSWPF
ncbi:hypothetical protein QOZ80_8BG0668850 [Eleusine coracana subsp. coracana]|nr:hypothetical protein QOZ80_8BG0668850 [Eleusine coracana subsp. coracana]